MAIHARLPGIVAEFQTGRETWMQFALEVGAISNSEQFRLLQRGRMAFEDVTATQAAYHQASDPALRFLGLIRIVRSTGTHTWRTGRERRRSHPVLGMAPEPKARRWIPQWARIGWVVARDVFLKPEVSYRVAQQFAGPERLPISAQTLRHRLREQGLLASVEVGRQTLLVCRIFERFPRKVLHLQRRFPCCASALLRPCVLRTSRKVHV
jgi:hypothetical protein